MKGNLISNIMTLLMISFAVIVASIVLYNILKGTTENKDRQRAYRFVAICSDAYIIVFSAVFLFLYRM